MTRSSNNKMMAKLNKRKEREGEEVRGNPRIVRVSSLFGGKDRHCKVYTVKGLRDRRIRLSVQTAIQLYDLQNKLGLSQPSKVIDWLIQVTKLDIDKLPPLQIAQFPLSSSSSSQLSSHQQVLNNGGFQFEQSPNNVFYSNFISKETMQDHEQSCSFDFDETSQFELFSLMEANPYPASSLLSSLLPPPSASTQFASSSSSSSSSSLMFCPFAMSSNTVSPYPFPYSSTHGDRNNSSQPPDESSHQTDRF